MRPTMMRVPPRVCLRRVAPDVCLFFYKSGDDEEDA
jgi:hypothetical protein